MIQSFVNGCFDVLHIGHLQILEYARSISDRLIVAIDSDSRIKQNKGINRPFNNQFDRKKFLESIKFVDDVFIFDSDEELENLVKINNIDYMIVGDDYINKNVIGSQYCKNLIFFQKKIKISTSKILNYGEYCSTTNDLS
jgi:D-beta-D-heptose 7-phosphate kinase/D-beta-D-heptose 1-phosphate adenosyltransferase